MLKPHKKGDDFTSLSSRKLEIDTQFYILTSFVSLLVFSPSHHMQIILIHDLGWNLT